ncbi:MAG: hypothetical protein ACR2J5_17535 [Geodermatophilaceae bacterium]
MRIVRDAQQTPAQAIEAPGRSRQIDRYSLSGHGRDGYQAAGHQCPEAAISDPPQPGVGGGQPVNTGGGGEYQGVRTSQEPVHQASAQAGTAVGDHDWKVPVHDIHGRRVRGFVEPRAFSWIEPAWQDPGAVRGLS